MQVKVNPGCISCGLCVSLCPQVFQIKEDGFSHVVGEVSSNLESEVQTAVANCPVQVIEIV